jgi:hypothetical protein
MEKIVKFPTHKFKIKTENDTNIDTYVYVPTPSPLTFPIRIPPLCTKTSVSDPYVFCADPNTDLDPDQNLNPVPDPAHRKM